jgi:hypothetical protein
MKRLEMYLKNRVEAIQLLLEKPRRSYTQRTFHNLRVELKKLNALFELINYCTEDFKRNKTFKPFEVIFKQAGKVRELQVEEAMLKKYFIKNLLIDYRSSLKKLRFKEQDDYFSIINKKNSKKLEQKFRKIIPFLEQVTKQKVNKYMNKKKIKIEKLLNENGLLEPQAHELRKRLKTFNYNQRVLNFWKKNKQSAKKDILPELLGKWNDCQVTISELEKAMVSGIVNSNEAGQIIKIKGKIASDSSNLFYLINTTIAKSKGSID